MNTLGACAGLAPARSVARRTGRERCARVRAAAVRSRRRAARRRRPWAHLDDHEVGGRPCLLLAPDGPERQGAGLVATVRSRCQDGAGAVIDAHDGVEQARGRIEGPVHIRSRRCRGCHKRRFRPSRNRWTRSCEQQRSPDLSRSRGVDNRRSNLATAGVVHTSGWVTGHRETNHGPARSQAGPSSSCQGGGRFGRSGVGSSSPLRRQFQTCSASGAPT